MEGGHTRNPLVANTCRSAEHSECHARTLAVRSRKSPQTGGFRSHEQPGRSGVLRYSGATTVMRCWSGEAGLGTNIGPKWIPGCPRPVIAVEVRTSGAHPLGCFPFYSPLRIEGLSAGWRPATFEQIQFLYADRRGRTKLAGSSPTSSAGVGVIDGFINLRRYTDV